MAASQISCPLCLCAYEPEGLIEIEIAHHAFLKQSAVKLCQECCAAVLETCVRRHNEAPPSYTGENDEAANGEAVEDEAENSERSGQ